MVESSGWESWNLPPLDDGSGVVPSAEKEAKDRYRTVRELRELQEQEDKEREAQQYALQEQTQNDENADEEEDETVEVVEDDAISLPSAEEIEQLRKSVELEAYAEGFEKGEKHGKESGFNQAYEEAKQEINKNIQNLDSIANTLLQPLDQQDEQIETILVNSVVTLVKSIVGRELKTQPELILSVVKKAIEALPFGEDKTTILLNPNDIEFIESHALDHPHWKLTPDPEISSGGCRIKTADSEVDATVESRLCSAIDQFLGKELVSGDDNAK